VRDGSLTPPPGSRAQPLGSRSVGCFLALLALLSPRLALFFAAIFSDILSRAYDSFIIPLLGFFLLPWTTLVYALAYDANPKHLTTFEWLLVAVAFLLDLGSYGFGQRMRGRRD
jgi:hypothetical protein